MRRVANFSLLLAPLLIAGASGCATPGFLAKSDQLDSRIARLDRLLTVAADYENNGRPEAAMSVYQHVLTEHPENSYARQRFDVLAKSDVTPSARDLQKNQLRQKLNPGAPDVLMASKRLPEAMRPVPETRQIARAETPVSRPTPTPAVPSINETLILTSSSESSSAVTSQKSADWNPVTLEAKKSYSHLDWAMSQLEARGTEAAAQQTATVDVASQSHWAATEFSPAIKNDWSTTDISRYTNPGETSDVSDDAWEPTRLISLCEGLDSSLHPAIEQLEATETAKRVDGLRTLSAAGEQARPALVAIHSLLNDSDPIVAVHAASTLRDVANDAWDSVQTLSKYLKHDDPQVVRLAAYLLGQVGPEAMAAVPNLEAVRENSDLQSSLYAAEALTHIAPDDQASFQKLNEALSNEDRSIRWFAAVSLGTVSERCEKDAIDALVKALRDSEPQVQAAACLSLGGFGQQASIAIDELEKAANSDSTEVKQAAETALACLRG